jgi:Putative peptidoglycan binding domain
MSDDGQLKPGSSRMRERGSRPSGRKTTSRRAETQAGISDRTALVVGCILLALVFVTLCVVNAPSLMLGLCLRIFLALAMALLSYLVSGKIALGFQSDAKTEKEKQLAKLKIAGSGGFAVLLAFGMFYNPLDARPFLAQIGFVQPVLAVAKAQDALTENSGYQPKVKGVADGDFVKKVSEVQRDKGLPITGVVDAQTLRMLGELEQGAPVVYKGIPAGLNTDGPGGEQHPTWQPTTTLRYSNGESINSRLFPIVTVPMNHKGAKKVHIGDYAAVYWPKEDRHTFALVGDLGPSQQESGPNSVARFDISPAVVSALGLPMLAQADAHYDVIAVVFAQSNKAGPVPAPAEVQGEGARLLKGWGGKEKLREIAR